jgi:hypothetical protein
MRRLQRTLVQCLLIGRALFFLLLPVSYASALAQNIPGPAVPAAGGENPPSCDMPITRLVADRTVTLTPQRGWQMVGRDIEIAITSSSLTAKAAPLVCFGWKLKEGKTRFAQIDSAQIVQRTQSASTIPASSTLKVAVNLPFFDEWPTKGTTVYTDDNSTPVGEFRVLLLDDGKLLDDVVTKVAVVAKGDYCNVPILGTRIDGGTIVPSASKNWQPVRGAIEFTAKSPNIIPSDALIKVCFRWKLTVGDPGPFGDSGPLHVIDKQPNTIKLAVEVPEMEGEQPSRFKGDRTGSYAVLYLFVPEADVRVLLFDNKLDLLFDTWTKTGLAAR